MHHLIDLETYFRKHLVTLSMHMFLTLLYISFLLGVDATTFTLQNKCSVTIWPGILPGAGQPMLMNGGLELGPGQSAKINAPAGWAGRFWPRSRCKFDQSGKGSCGTGDCGGKLQCNGAGGAPPASLAEFTLNASEGKDFYDISLVDGFNVPTSVFPSGGLGNCTQVKCVVDVNRLCPGELQVRSSGVVIACKSACIAFNKPEYCCTGPYGSPQTCKPTKYSKVFKNACPTAYSYPYDDKTSLFTCKGADYLITFC